MPRQRRDERGTVAILTGMVATVLFVSCALVIDLGLARDTRGQAQITADASALAGAGVLYPRNRRCSDSSLSPCLTDAVNEAIEYAETNMGIPAADWTSAGAGCSVPSGFSAAPGRTPCITFDSLTLPTKVRVVIPTRNIKPGFGVLAGIDDINISAAARATLLNANQGKCALCFLGPVTVGNGDFDIRGSSVHVNGDLNIGAGSYWTAANVYVAGTWNPSDVARITPDPEPALTITDPYAADPRFPPSTAGLTTKSGSPCSGGPGIYNSYTWDSNEDCTIAPGLYVIDGTWQLKNNSGITGNGVTLYVRNGALDFKNSGKVNLKAPTAAQAAATPSADIEGFVIVYDRTNGNELSLQGNGTTNNDGTGCSSSGTPSLVGGVYAANGRLSVNGTSCLGVDKGPIVVLGVDRNMDFTGTKSGLLLTGSQEIDIDNLPKELALDQ